VTFTVDAYPARRSPGVVSQVRFEPVVVQNVVNYIAIVDVENPDLKLRPGMTANAAVVTAPGRMPAAAERGAAVPAGGGCAVAAEKPAAAGLPESGGRRGGDGAAAPAGGTGGQVAAAGRRRGRTCGRCYVLDSEGRLAGRGRDAGHHGRQLDGGAGPGLPEGERIVTGDAGGGGAGARGDGGGEFAVHAGAPRRGMR
jgi:HlyD family secretion protein